MKKFFTGSILILLSVSLFPPSSFAQAGDVLSAEEVYWLQSRNNTIVVYPEENNPPYSYRNSAGNPQGLAIDYLELIGEKIGVKIVYLTPRPRSQILSDIQSGKGDIIAALTPDKEKEGFLLFTTNYLSSSSVLVVRKDYDKRSGLNPANFNGKRMAVVKNSALESYMRVNYPRIILEEVTDSEIGLQKVVLGEVEAVAMDVASLSYYLSKQVLSSVKVVGNTGFEYKPSFGIAKASAPLQSILEKGLSQISITERQQIFDKWINLPDQKKTDETLLAHIQNNISMTSLYILFGVGIIGIITLLFRRRAYPVDYFRRPMMPSEGIESEVSTLEKSNKMIAEELKAIKAEEEKLARKLDSINQSQNVQNPTKNAKSENEPLKESSSIE
jgi:ABC-type amino acid transport substrate-binding protein